jgi:hypothetical protein
MHFSAWHYSLELLQPLAIKHPKAERQAGGLRVYRMVAKLCQYVSRIVVFLMLHWLVSRVPCWHTPKVNLKKQT